MMKKSILILVIFIFGVLAFWSFSNKAFAQDCSNPDECKKLIDEYESKLTGIRAQKNTLSSQIQYFDTQIYIATTRIRETELKIKQTEEEIVSLGEKIDGLNTSLDYLGKILIKKIVEGYKRKETTIINLIIDSNNALSLSSQLKYIQIAQDNDRRIAFQVQTAKNNYEEQKALREKKKIELATLQTTLNNQKASLDTQKAIKQKLLADTNNDETNYQNLLAQVRAEYNAIEGIIAGSGNEIKMREVKKGESIASVISGASCNSSGAHLHFIVKEDSSVTTQNPFNYLKSVDYSNCSGSGCGSGDSDQFNPSGNWDWPLDPKIELAQGYGNTWATRNTWVRNIYTFHNGIDFIGSSSDVKAVSDGTLYKGGMSGSGCTLSYVKLVHKDSNLATLYLHVYPK